MMNLFPSSGDSPKIGRRPSTSASYKKDSPSQLSMDAAMEGPPSPGRIRAYTEQMKRNTESTHSRTNTATSATSSFGSDTGSKSPDSSLSRRGSRKSSLSSERPQSKLFSKSIFTRGSKKTKEKQTGRFRASSSLSLYPIEDGATPSTGEEQCFKKHLISGPYNFQHVVHTGQEGVPNVDIADSAELQKEFATVRRSNTQSGDLKGIKAEDIHFQNFSFDTLDSIDEADMTGRARAKTSPTRMKRISRKPAPSIQLPDQRPTLRTSQSYSDFQAPQVRGPPPPRPPRSPMTLVPARTSSKTASMIWDEYDPLSTTPLERPHYASGFRRPQAFHLPLSSPPLASVQAPSSREAQDYFQGAPLSPRPINNTAAGWPFAAPSLSKKSLGHVIEEEELATGNPRSRTSMEIRNAKSVPNLLSFRRASSRLEGRPHTPTPDDMQPLPMMSPGRRGLNDSFDSWEDDIDYCYEHEAEADCDYNWERRSFDTEIGHNVFHDSAICTNDEAVLPKSSHPPVSLHRASESISRRLSAQLNQQQSIPTPTLSPPSPTSSSFSRPNLTPASQFTSQSSVSSLRTPASIHLRSPSHASSFKESQGFTLSPSLLIPQDFATQMHLEGHSPSIDHAQFTFDNESFVPLHANDYSNDTHDISAPESISSYRTSANSRMEGLRGSGGSSSSLASKAAPMHRQLNVLERAAEVALAHRSLSSSGSLPELIASARSTDAATKRPEPLKQEPMSAEEQSKELVLQMAEEKLLPPSPAPCAQAQMGPPTHNRKGSVPLLSGKNVLSGEKKPEMPKRAGRARAATVGSAGKIRASLSLFPAPPNGAPTAI